MRHTLLRVIPATLLASAISSTPALAIEIEEIVVTAEKRSQSIQDIPMSVAAISGDDIGVGKVSGMEDVAMKTPGVSFQQFNIGEPRVFIRGIGNTSDSAASDSAVGMFIDEVYIGRAGGSGSDLFDLERIEILRGPQGTLYGKNTNGGAINFITSKPTQDDLTKVSMTVGNEGLFHVQGLINGGITDSVSGKLTMAHKQRDGFGKNVITQSENNFNTSLTNSPIIGNDEGANGNGDDLGDIENFNLRGQLMFDLSDSTSLLLSGDYSKDKSNGTCRHLEDLDQGLAGLGAFWALSQSVEYSSDKRNCSSQFDTGQEKEVKGFSAHFNHDMEWANLLSITAWRTSELRHIDDLTSIPLIDTDSVMPAPLNTAPENVINGVEEEASQFSQEFRLSGTHDSIDWITGVFYMQEDVERDEEYYTRYSGLLQGAPFYLAPEGSVLFVQDNTTTSLAAYGQADWHVTEDLTLTYGVRWSKDEKEISQSAIDLFEGSITGIAPVFGIGVPLIYPEFGPVKGKEDWEEVTHKASVSYQVSDDAMLYLSYSEGFKSGAFPSQSNTAANATQTVDPEFVENIELGIKSTWFDNRLQFNLAYYDINYNDLQVFELTPALLLSLNNAQAESKGYEATVMVAATENLTLSASYNDGEARFEKFINAGGNNYAGNLLPMSSDKSGTLDIDYSIPLSNGSMIDVNVNYNWKDDYYMSSSNAEKTKQEAIGKVDASISWTGADESLTISAWGKNLTDKDQIGHTIVDPTAVTSKKYMDPKTYGVTFTKSF